MRLKVAQPWAGRHFQASAVLWLLTAQIWPLLGILEFAPPSSDRAWWAWGQAWLCCTQRGKFLSPCLYGTCRRRSSWCFHCQLSFPRWPHAPHTLHLAQQPSVSAWLHMPGQHVPPCALQMAFPIPTEQCERLWPRAGNSHFPALGGSLVLGIPLHLLLLELPRGLLNSVLSFSVLHGPSKSRMFILSPQQLV